MRMRLEWKEKWMLLARARMRGISVSTVTFELGTISPILAGGTASSKASSHGGRGIWSSPAVKPVEQCADLIDGPRGLGVPDGLAVRGQHRRGQVGDGGDHGLDVGAGPEPPRNPVAHA